MRPLRVLGTARRERGPLFTLGKKKRADIECHCPANFRDLRPRYLELFRVVSIYSSFHLAQTDGRLR